MKRNVMRLFVVAALAVCLTLSLAGCGEKQAENPDAIDPAYVAQLEQECVDLRNQLQALTNQIGDLEQSVVLKSYALKAVPNEDATGASVEITAVPMRYQEDQTVLFRVTLDGQEQIAADGQWDGTAYVASVGLPAADGSAYECVLTRPDGTQSSIVLSSPDSPLYESCVYLQASLSAYCTMIVDTSSLEGEELVLNTGYAQIQLPRIGNRTLEISSSDLVLKLGDTELQRIPVEVPTGEAEGSFELVLENIRFALPADSEGKPLDLWFEVTLSDEQLLSYNGCSWTVSEGQLVVSAG